ncbi:MAG: hypothetical protein AAGK97_13900 [Bacteroidota bacterium]
MRVTKQNTIQNLDFPIKFVFKVSSFANDFTATDANGNVIAYVRQKLFKLKEAIQIFSDESKSELIYTIQADKWLDFSAAYSFKDEEGNELGKIARKGWASIWKANYEIIDQHQQLQYNIKEDNGWVKVIDSILGEIPILGMFTGYMFNPSYSVIDSNNQAVAKLVKEPSMMGRRFEVQKLTTFDADDDERIMLALMMMILLERRRG